MHLFGLCIANKETLWAEEYSMLVLATNLPPPAAGGRQATSDLWALAFLTQLTIVELKKARRGLTTPYFFFFLSLTD